MRGSKSESYTGVDIGFRCALSDRPLTVDLPASAPGEPYGKIVFTCQVTGNEETNQLCMVNADGSGWQQLTSNYSANFTYPSLSPDGKSIIYVSNESGNYEIFELPLGVSPIQLTFGIGKLNAPEISPDGKSIVFTNKTGGNTVWLMNRDGSNTQEIFGQPRGWGWDPTWSADDSQILFASGSAQNPNLKIMDRNGQNVRLAANLEGIRGRSDWSPDGRLIATYLGESWVREIYIFNSDGTDIRQITREGNNLAPSFSPDGQWLAFTSYRDNYGDNNGCEIYIMKIDGSDIRRLTNNDYCDWQPRWGP